MAGLYIHVPFCINKCPYCSFYSIPQNESQVISYVSYLKKEINLRKQQFKDVVFDTVYIGGGTPTAIGERLFQIVELIYSNFHFENELEFTVEVNPGTVSGDYLRELKRWGVNRLSIGVQSLNERELLFLGRIHNVKQALEVVKNAEISGFSNISVDLIFAFPGHTLKTWERTLSVVLNMPITHLSSYEFTFEDNTPFQKKMKDGIIKPIDEDLAIELTDILEEKTYQYGFFQYEISNFAKNSYECRHNINYWENGEYLGLGPSAVTYFKGVREKSVSDLMKYFELLDGYGLALEYSEILDNEGRFRESFVLSLRQRKKIFFSKFIEKFGINPISYYRGILIMLQEKGLIEFDDEKIEMTKKGFRLSNYVLSYLV